MWTSRSKVRCFINDSNKAIFKRSNFVFGRYQPLCQLFRGIKKKAHSKGRAVISNLITLTQKDRIIGPHRRHSANHPSKVWREWSLIVITIVAVDESTDVLNSIGRWQRNGQSVDFLPMNKRENHARRFLRPRKNSKSVGNVIKQQRNDQIGRCWIPAKLQIN
jgi:hypothetical protein